MLNNLLAILLEQKVKQNESKTFLIWQKTLNNL